MSNIKNYNSNKLDFKLSGSQYYDFYLNSDAIKGSEHYSDNLIASFKFDGYTELYSDFLFGSIPNVDTDFAKTNNDFYHTYTIVSETDWDGSIESEVGYSPNDYVEATTAGLTGIDNGLFPYDQRLDDYEHTILLDTLTGSTIHHSPNDVKLVLKQVSGATRTYQYPSSISQDSGTTGNYLSLCGGFFQGYYKLDGYPYQTLPTRYKKGWSISTWLRPTNCINNWTILNDTYPDNKGFFYYVGTRAENKFWNIFSGNTTEACMSGDTGLCTDTKETDIMVDNIMVDGILSGVAVPLSPPPVDVEHVKNQFLIFGRSNGYECAGDESGDGFGQVRADSDYDKDEKFYSKIVRKETTNFTNQFLIYGRSNGYECAGDKSDDGYGQVRADSDWEGTTEPVMELDKDSDLTDNAFGLRIKDDGSIGYRLLTLSGDCQSVEVIEEYSEVGLVNVDDWSHIFVKWVNNDQFDECDLIQDDARKGKLKFYINSKLLFVSQELLEQIPKRLFDIAEKQVGVPYNLSIGGGTQGLIESMTFDGQDPDDLGLIIEKNFAGSFIGDISTFDLFNKNLSWCQIKDIYNNSKDKYNEII